jgi:hypothetical protein
MLDRSLGKVKPSYSAKRFLSLLSFIGFSIIDLFKFFELYALSKRASLNANVI